jgi:2-succinyl-5-enolpyruvyl-6-hydroxy-3-cyclohexene-1-carboxylate synthase
VVQLGASWASKALTAFLAEAELVQVDPWWRWEDPSRRASVVHRVDPVAWLDAARETVALRPSPGWLGGWQDAERAAQKAIEDLLGESELSEPLVARRVARGVPEGSILVVSSSMPVRDLEWFSLPREDPPKILANRGANGIDGVCATALGAAAAGTGPVVALVGDLAFFHDLSSLVRSADGPDPGSCTIVVVDNGGGGIFELLAHRSLLERAVRERLFATPPVPDVVEAAKGLGVETADVGTPEELGEALAEGTRHDGVTALVGYIEEEATIDPGRWLGKDITVVASMGFARRDVRHVMSLVADGRVRVAPLHSRTIALEGLDPLLQALAGGGSPETKVLVAPR